MGVKSVKVHCDKRTPPEKHRWMSSGSTQSGVNERERWKCAKCGRTTIIDDVRQST